MDPIFIELIVYWENERRTPIFKEDTQNPPKQNEKNLQTTYERGIKLSGEIRYCEYNGMIWSMELVFRKGWNEDKLCGNGDI